MRIKEETEIIEGEVSLVGLATVATPCQHGCVCLALIVDHSMKNNWACARHG